MSDAQQARDRHRQTLALEGISKYLGDLVRVMAEVSKQLAEFGKVVKEPTPTLVLNDPGQQSLYDGKKEGE